MSAETISRETPARELRTITCEVSSYNRESKNTLIEIACKLKMERKDKSDPATGAMTILILIPNREGYAPDFNITSVSIEGAWLNNSNNHDELVSMVKIMEHHSLVHATRYHRSQGKALQTYTNSKE